MPENWPTGLQIHTPVKGTTPEEKFAEFLLDMRQHLRRQNQKVFDSSHPVDEYVTGPGFPAASPIEIQPTYAAFSERIDTIVIAGLSPNATGVTLQLGDRIIPIDVTRGAALGGLIVIDCGIVLKPHERRLLNYTSFGNTVSQPGVPASGTAVQNPNNAPITVVLSGFTATQVFVNGILVGAGNGTYTVPSLGSISVTYSVVGTWTWTPPQYNGYFIGLFGYASDVFETV